jgi:hypothetical protein
MLRGPVELRGKKVRCKGCATAFVVATNAPLTSGAAPTPAPSASRGKPAPVAARPAAPNPKSPPPKSKSPAPNPKSAPPAPRTPSPPSSLQEKDPALYAFLSEDEALNQITQYRESKPLGSDIQSLGEPAPRGPAAQNPYDLTEMSLAPRCPHCAHEMPSEEAVICLHCGYNTQTRRHIEVKRTYENTAQDRFYWRLPGILCLLGCLLSIGFIVFLWVGLDWAAEQDRDAWWTFIDGLWFQVWASAFAAFGAWYTGKFAFFRLIRNPNPPEVEKEAAGDTLT